mmetsp:Transcript_9855/g.44925  ORF Transcript_9855/g.44925 Transcript_9855/m.44925 type:complete len:275 (+) Transcript_9855:749-1573(+)
MPASTGPFCCCPCDFRRANVLGLSVMRSSSPCANAFCTRLIATTALTAPLKSVPVSRSFWRFFWTLSRCTRGVVGGSRYCASPFRDTGEFPSQGCVASARSAVILCFSSTVRNRSMRSFASPLTSSHTDDCVKLKLPVRISSYIVCSSSCANGVYPASKTKSNTPHAQLSTEGPCACGTAPLPLNPTSSAASAIRFASSTSGEMYSGVPEGNELLRALAFFAKPKSQIFTLSRSVLDASNRFSSFKSQCVTPTSCRYWTPNKIRRNTFLAMCSS